MDMFRWPQIIHLADVQYTKTPAARFIVLMEVNGAAGPYQQPAPGQIFRQDITIPHSRRNDPAYIAEQFKIAWARIHKMAAGKK